MYAEIRYVFTKEKNSGGPKGPPFHLSCTLAKIGIASSIISLIQFIFTILVLFSPLSYISNYISKDLEVMNSKEIVREIGRFYTYDYKTPIHASPPEFEPYLDERL